MLGFGQRVWQAVVVVGVVAGSACGAVAQTAPAAPAAGQQAPAIPAVGQAPAPSASALAAARDVVIASGMARSFAPMVPELSRQIVPTVTRTHPELQKDLTEVVNALQPEFLKDGEQMTEIAAQIYARRMSEDELKQTAAFFKSPAGVKYVDVQPGMLDELVVAMQSWTQQLSSLMMNRVRDEMAKRGHQML